MHVVIPETLKKEFKVTCVMEGRNMSEVVVKLIQSWMEEQGKKGKAQPARQYDDSAF